jgi:hypothetical protein
LKQSKFGEDVKMKKLIIVLTLLLLVPAYAFGVEINKSVVSTQTNLRELMQNHLAQLQRILMGIMYQNSYAAAQGAVGLAFHPIPAEGTAKGSPVYYIVPEQRKAFWKWAPAFHEAETGPGTFLKLEEAAKKEDWDTALQLYHQILDSCVACHNLWKKHSIDNVILERNKEEISKMKKTIVQ